MADSIVDRLFQRADELKQDKVILFEEVAANRRSLRDLASQGLLTDAQVRKVTDLYPTKQRGETAQDAA